MVYTPFSSYPPPDMTNAGVRVAITGLKKNITLMIDTFATIQMIHLMILSPSNWLRVVLCILVLLPYGTTIAQTNRVTQAIDELMTSNYAPDLPGATVLVAVDDKILLKKG